MSLRSIFESFADQTERFAESNGYYDRVPIRVGDFALVENSEGLIKFETTSREFCNEGPKVTLTISNGDDNSNNWSVNKKQGPYHSCPVPTADLTDSRLSRRRACWHAVQIMLGRELSHRERFTLIHQTRVDEEDKTNVFEDDAFFKHGDAVTNDPFGEVLEDK